MNDSKYSIAFFCPDTNIKLSGDAPAIRGLGGGKTAIIKMADALCRAGNDVKVYAYCDEGVFHGVEYCDIRRPEHVSADIVVAISGHKGDLSDIYERTIHAKLKVLWLSGAGFIHGIDDSFFDCYYTNSVFLKKRAVVEWKLPFEKAFATRQGFAPEDFDGAGGVSVGRDPFGIVFASHPGKGLDRTVEIIRKLREENDRLFLDIYGGYSLWDEGDRRALPFAEDWIGVKGLVSQPELCRSLFRYTFMLHVTDYEDTHSIVIQQAKKAGVIVIASAVGGNAEILENGYDGFLIEEHYRDAECEKRVKSLIEYLLRNQDYANYICKNAGGHSVTWDKIAEEWMDHWDEYFDRNRKKRVVIAGYYGYQNLGDEAILSSVLKEIRALDQAIDIIVVSGDPFYTEKMHEVRAVPNDNFRLQAKVVGNADLVVLGGGGLFQDHHRISIPQFFEDHTAGVTSYATIPLMGAILQKSVIYLAQGVGPLFSRESVFFSRWAFDLADSISVRDEYSYRVLVEFLAQAEDKVSLSSDPVYRGLFDNSERADHLFFYYNIPRNRKIVCVSLRSWINERLEERTVAEVADALSDFLKNSPEHHIVFIPFYRREKDEGDMAIICRVAERLPEAHSIIRNYTRPGELIALYKAADFSVGMRYHSLIFSALASTPMICLSYDEKDNEFMADLGLTSLLLQQKDFLSKDLAGLMCSVSEERAKYQGMIRKGVEKLIARGSQDKRTLERLLNG